MACCGGINFSFTNKNHHFFTKHNADGFFLMLRHLNKIRISGLKVTIILFVLKIIKVYDNNFKNHGTMMNFITIC